MSFRCTSVSLHIRGAKLAVHLGKGLPRSIGPDGLARAQLLQALHVRLLASSLQTFSQYSSGGSRMTCFCKGVVALAQGDKTERLEMASGLSQYSALPSLLQVTVVQVALCLPWCNGVTVWTRYGPFLSLAVDVSRVAQFGIGLPTFPISSSLAHFTLCQCRLSDIAVSSVYVLSLMLSERSSSVHCAQTTRNALVPASMHYLPLVLSTPRCVPQVVLDLPSYRAPCLRIRAAKRILHLDARLPTVIDLRGFLRLPRQQAFAVGFLRLLLVFPGGGHRKAAMQRPDCATLCLVRGGHTQSTMLVLCLTVRESLIAHCLSALGLPLRNWVAAESR